MALNNVLLLSQTAGYVVALILSLCVIVPTSLHLDEFGGHCLLFSTGKWQEADGQFKVQWGSKFLCHYGIIVAVMSFIISAVQIYRMSVFLHHGTDSSFLSAALDFLVICLICFLTILSAFLITFGFMVWCQNMTQRFPSCEMAAGQEIDKADNINTNGFYFELGIAQFGAWGSFATWVGLAVFALLKLCQYHQLENVRVSMYHERQKLIGEDLSTSNSSQNRNVDYNTSGSTKEVQ